MKDNISTVFFSLLVIVVGVFGVKLVSQLPVEIKGVTSTTETTTSLPVNQDIRSEVGIPVYSEYLKSLLYNISELSNEAVFNLQEGVIFHWTTPVDEVEVIGLGISIKNTTHDTESKITQYLQNVGFEFDPYNVTGGVPGHMSGLVKNNQVCVVRSIISNYDAGGIYDPNVLDIEIRCGEIPEKKSDNIQETTMPN